VAARATVVHARRANRGAVAALDRWARLGVRRFAVVGLLGRIWELRENLTAYDASYVALAEVLGCGLVTADARLAHADHRRPPLMRRRRRAQRRRTSFIRGYERTNARGRLSRTTSVARPLELLRRSLRRVRGPTRMV
jgi:hypothetical protein